MRPNCPVCGLAPIDSFSTRYAIPDGWRLPSDYRWQLCKCGFIWADTDARAEDFDQFYREYYNPHVDAHDLHRMQNLASFIFEHVKPNARVVDFGGGEGYLANYLRELGFENVSVVNLDDKMPKCDVVILSQVIEHLYDLERDLNKIDANLENGGLIFIETPEAVLYQFKRTPALMDYYPTHVNHFNNQTLPALASKYGWLALGYLTYQYQPTNAPMMRCQFQKSGMEYLFNNVAYRIKNIEPVECAEPVIIYGLGDFALYQIANSELNIVYFVDEAEVYRGATLNGIPVKQALEDDGYPVMVISNRHRAEILGKLKGRRVIEA